MARHSLAEPAHTRRRVLDRQADADAHARLGGGLRDHFGKQMLVGEASRAAGQRGGDGQFGAIAHVFSIDPALLQQPDAVRPMLERTAA